MKLKVPEMSCGHCVTAIDSAVKAADTTATIRADLPSRTVDIDTTASPETLLKILADAGYPSTTLASN